jgi:hypothetical protein
MSDSSASPSATSQVPPYIADPECLLAFLQEMRDYETPFHIKAAYACGASKSSVRMICSMVEHRMKFKRGTLNRFIDAAVTIVERPDDPPSIRCDSSFVDARREWIRLNAVPTAVRVMWDFDASNAFATKRWSSRKIGHVVLGVVSDYLSDLNNTTVEWKVKQSFTQDAEEEIDLISGEDWSTYSFSDDDCDAVDALTPAEELACVERIQTRQFHRVKRYISLLDRELGNLQKINKKIASLGGSESATRLSGFVNDMTAAFERM